MSAIVKWNNAGPFRSTKFGPRQYRKGTALGKKVTFTYPNKPPTEQQQRALMTFPAVACSSCLVRCQENNQCHAKWLVAFLKTKLALDRCPEVLSSAIPKELTDEARKTGDWSGPKAIHHDVYVERKAVLLMRKGHPRGVPSLIENMTSGASLFGNPFTSIPIPLNRALYHRYMEKGFEPLTQEEVDQVAASGRWSE